MTPLPGYNGNKSVPEISQLIGRKLVTMENGLSEVHFELGDIWLNLQGILHGGAFATMLDTACGVASRSMLDFDKYRGQVTLELKTSFFKAGRPGAYIAKGKVLRMGRSVSFSEAVLFNDKEQEVARASATFKLLPREPG